MKNYLSKLNPLPVFILLLVTVLTLSGSLMQAQQYTYSTVCDGGQCRVVATPVQTIQPARRNLFSRIFSPRQRYYSVPSSPTYYSYSYPTTISYPTTTVSYNNGYSGYSGYSSPAITASYASAGFSYPTAVSTSTVPNCSSPMQSMQAVPNCSSPVVATSTSTPNCGSPTVAASSPNCSAPSVPTLEQSMSASPAPAPAAEDTDFCPCCGKEL